MDETGTINEGTLKVVTRYKFPIHGFKVTVNPQATIYTLSVKSYYTQRYIQFAEFATRNDMLHFARRTGLPFTDHSA